MTAAAHVVQMLDDAGFRTVERAVDSSGSPFALASPRPVLIAERG